MRRVGKKWIVDITKWAVPMVATISMFQSVSVSVSKAGALPESGGILSYDAQIAADLVGISETSVPVQDFSPTFSTWNPLATPTDLTVASDGDFTSATSSDTFDLQASDVVIPEAGSQLSIVAIGAMALLAGMRSARRRNPRIAA